uniref:Talin-2 n=1 Tax=Sphaerodactylus townsendi TaxID=933632 RepID=A0ACB8E586_9SAUR
MVLLESWKARYLAQLSCKKRLKELKPRPLHQQLVQSCKNVADHIPQLVQGVRGSQAQAEDLSAQLALINSSQNFLQPGSKMVASAKAAVPTVADQAAAMQLSQCAKNLATSLAELRTASQKAHEACGPMEIDSALNTVQTLKNELQDAKMAAIDGQLKPLPGETLEKCAQDLGITSKAVRPWPSCSPRGPRQRTLHRY